MTQPIGNAIAMSAVAQQFWANGQDAELIAELNKPQKKRLINGGLVTMATVAAVSQELAAAAGLLFKKASLFYGNPVNGETDVEAEVRQGRHELFLSCYERFRSASIGAPIDSDAFRQNFSYHALAIPNVIGIVTPWTQEMVDAFLSFGAVYESISFLTLGRDAVQSDITAYREWTVKEKVRHDYGLVESQIQEALVVGDRAGLASTLRSIADGLEAG